jgi:hypothetical protein
VSAPPCPLPCVASLGGFPTEVAHNKDWSALSLHSSAGFRAEGVLYFTATANILGTVSIRLASDLKYRSNTHLISAADATAVAGDNGGDSGLVTVSLLLDQFGTAGSWNSLELAVWSAPLTYKLRNVGLCAACAHVLFVNHLSGWRRTQLEDWSWGGVTVSVGAAVPAAVRGEPGRFSLIAALPRYSGLTFYVATGFAAVGELRFQGDVVTALPERPGDVLHPPNAGCVPKTHHAAPNQAHGAPNLSRSRLRRAAASVLHNLN